MRDVDQIIQAITKIYPAVKVRQLKVSHPEADDDGIWFFEQPGRECEVQIESPKGMCPFLIETDQSDTRFTANSVEETVETLTKLLHLEPGR
ncbi:MAG TPA: hypothetical protein VKE93_15735 [Candidatus Angelobacter sp.]|nr:hypothetical protein [Candidatus Angelobacter sp.]